MDRLISAEEVFQTVERNFLTPNVLSYHVAGIYAIELSEGLGVHQERLLGVSVMKREISKPSRDLETKTMSKLLPSLQEAECYIRSIKRRVMLNDING